MGAAPSAAHHMNQFVTKCSCAVLAVELSGGDQRMSDAIHNWIKQPRCPAVHTEI